MRAVVALGGNALAKRGEPMTAEYLARNIAAAMAALAKFAGDNEVVITHGNGPQVGLLSLQNLAYPEVDAYPLDILGAQTQGMIGYVIQQELENAMGGKRQVITVLTRTLVDGNDPAFDDPTKFIGPQYDKAQARELADKHGWNIAADGDGYRRVVSSPAPKAIVEAPLIKQLLEAGSLVVCVGGGGIPVKDAGQGQRVGVEAVVDKDAASAELTTAIGANTLLMLTDGDFVSQNWGTPAQRDILTASAEEISKLPFAAGSMGPKVDAAVRVARAGGRVLIGPLDRLEDVLARKVGTEILPELEQGIIWV